MACLVAEYTFMMVYLCCHDAPAFWYVSEFGWRALLDPWIPGAIVAHIGYVGRGSYIHFTVYEWSAGYGFSSGMIDCAYQSFCFAGWWVKYVPKLPTCELAVMLTRLTDLDVPVTCIEWSLWAVVSSINRCTEWAWLEAFWAMPCPWWFCIHYSSYYAGLKFAFCSSR
jgi:hypothetical protein